MLALVIEYSKLMLLFVLIGTVVTLSRFGTQSRKLTSPVGGPACPGHLAQEGKAVPHKSGSPAQAGDDDCKLRLVPSSSL